MGKIEWDKVKTRLDALLVIDEYRTDPNKTWRIQDFDILPFTLTSVELLGCSQGQFHIWSMNFRKP